MPGSQFDLQIRKRLADVVQQRADQHRITAPRSMLHLVFGTRPERQPVPFTEMQRIARHLEQVDQQAARLRAKTDPHSSGQWRVNGTVQNFDVFGKAFGCKVGQPMMPEKSCRVW